MLLTIILILCILCVLKSIGLVETRRQRKSIEKMVEVHEENKEMMLLYTDLLNQEVSRIYEKFDQKFGDIPDDKKE